MKSKLRLISLSIIFSLLLAVDVSAQKNEVRISYGDAVALEFAGGFTSVLFDAFSGEHSSTSGYGTFSVGYRYLLNRVGFGVDLSYIPLTNKVRMKDSNEIDYQSNQNFFMILPTVNCNYLKREYVELYGSVGLGLSVGDAKYEGKTAAGKDFVKGLSSGAQLGFAFQLIPIGLRVGSDSIGGFLELGYGVRGFVTAGLSIRF